MNLFNTIIILLLSLLTTTPQTKAQTNVGCSAACPPLGYEYDSTHLCPGDTVDFTTSSRQHSICHPTSTSSLDNTNLYPNNKLSFGQYKQSGYVTVIANYYTGCEAGRRESGVYAGLAQRIHDATSSKVNFITSLKGGGDCYLWAGIYQNDALSMGLNGGVKPSTMPLTLSDDNLDLRDRFFTPPYPHPSCKFCSIREKCD